ncbi:hypothetical protein SNE40_012254 [Patella caerulea]|uniref:CENP-V/GFA domain-containing protein n=1 Tax=Patella caerulea TaxID=87958 RepID=A0AAN8JR70_PATCE
MEVEHLGGCHCGAVRFKVLAPRDLNVLSCNCSICKMKQNVHFVVPSSKFTLLQGQDSLTLYQFNTKQAKHQFCKICGVQSFYTPRSNPDGVGITHYCLDPGTVDSVNVECFDGENWETSFSNSDIRNRSKAD